MTFIQVTAVDHNEQHFAVTINAGRIKHIRAVSEGHPKVVLSLARADSPEVLHLPTTIVQARGIFPHLLEADEYSPAEARIVGKLLFNPAVVTSVRKALQSAYTIQFDTGGPVNILSIPAALMDWDASLEQAEG